MGIDWVVESDWGHFVASLDDTVSTDRSEEILLYILVCMLLSKYFSDQWFSLKMKYFNLN